MCLRRNLLRLSVLEVTLCGVYKPSIWIDPINLQLLMGKGIATWRSRIGLFTPCQIHHIRQLHAHTKPGTNQGTTMLFVLIIITKSYPLGLVP